MAVKSDLVKQVKDFSTPAIAFAIDRDPKTGTVYFGTSDFGIYEADPNADKVEPKLLYKHESYASGVAKVGDKLISAGYDGRMIWWDLKAGKEVRAIDAHEKWIRRLALSADQKRVATVADDMVAKIWDAESGQLIHELHGHEPVTPHHYNSMLYGVVFSNDGKLLATADKLGHVKVWDVNTGKEVGSVDAPILYTWEPKARLHSIGGARSVAFSPDNKQLAVGGMGKVGNIDHLGGKARLEVFDWKAGEQLHEFESDKFNGLINVLVWAPDSSWLLASGGSHEGFIEVYDMKAGKVAQQEKAGNHVHDAWVNDKTDELILATHSKISLWKLG